MFWKKKKTKYPSGLFKKKKKNSLIIYLAYYVYGDNDHIL